MFGRFFAFEMGCPDEDASAGSKDLNTSETVAFLNQDGSVSLAPGRASDQGDGQAPEGSRMICECRGLGCNKCKRKKAKVITLTGGRIAPVPVMNLAMPFSPGMIMMTKQGFH